MTTQTSIPIGAIGRPIKGRGSSQRLAHRFERDQREAADDGWGLPDELATEQSDAQRPATQVSHEHAKSIVSRNVSPDIRFDQSINPYRGCEHGCIYCYARPTHSYLNLSPGLDFETRIQAKVNAVDLLRRELSRSGYQAKPIHLGAATDVYQPAERELGITRGLIELLIECRHPFSITTKGGGIVRDVDLLAEAARLNLVVVDVSVTTLDNRLHSILEPRASSPARRLAAIKALSTAGVPVHVNFSPIIPFINEPELEQVLQAAAKAGATSGHWTVLRLPWEVNPLFQTWLQQHFPQRAARVMARVRDMRGGADYQAEFKTRMKGEGVWAELIRTRFEAAARKHGLGRSRTALNASQFVPPAPSAKATSQASLF
jgi:DNA repair photolyase